MKTTALKTAFNTAFNTLFIKLAKIVDSTSSHRLSKLEWEIKIIHTS